MDEQDNSKTKQGKFPKILLFIFVLLAIGSVYDFAFGGIVPQFNYSIWNWTGNIIYPNDMNTTINVTNISIVGTNANCDTLSLSSNIITCGNSFSYWNYTDNKVYTRHDVNITGNVNVTGYLIINGFFGIGTNPARAFHINSGSLNVGERLESNTAVTKLEIKSTGGTGTIASQNGRITFDVPVNLTGNTLVEKNFTVMDKIFLNPQAITVGGTCQTGYIASNLTGSLCYCVSNRWKCLA